MSKKKRDTIDAELLDSATKFDPEITCAHLAIHCPPAAVTPGHAKKMALNRQINR